MQNTKSNVYNMVFVPKGTVGRPSWVVFVYIDWNIWFHFSLQSRSWLRRSFGIMLIIFSIHWEYLNHTSDRFLVIIVLLLQVVSWISFLIPPDIVPGRMALLITLFLVLINIFNNVTTNSPKVTSSYSLFSVCRHCHRRHLVLINIFNNVITKFWKVNKIYLIWQDVVNKYFDFQAEGLTAIEIWMLACILFVFGL